MVLPKISNRLTVIVPVTGVWFCGELGWGDGFSKSSGKGSGLGDGTGGDVAGDRNDGVIICGVIELARFCANILKVKAK